VYTKRKELYEGEVSMANQRGRANRNTPRSMVTPRGPKENELVVQVGKEAEVPTGGLLDMPTGALKSLRRSAGKKKNES